MSLEPYILSWAVPTVLGGLLGYAIGLLKKLKAAKEHEDDTLKDMQDTLDAIALMTCRLAIYDEHFSNDEKIEAYRLYRKKGGNHQTKKYMDDLLGEDADVYLARHE
jgi:hypothetical protein